MWNRPSRMHAFGGRPWQAYSRNALGPLRLDEGPVGAHYKTNRDELFEAAARSLQAADD